MCQDWLGHALHIVRQNEVASANGRQGLDGTEQGERRTRAAAEQHVFVFPRGVDDLQDAVAHLVVHVDGANRLLGGDDVLGFGDRREVVDRMATWQRRIRGGPELRGSVLPFPRGLHPE